MEIIVTDKAGWYEKTKDATSAVLSKNITSITAGTGITINNSVYLRFEDGSSGLHQDSEGVWVVGVLTLETTGKGSSYYINVKNGIDAKTAIPAVPGTPVEYEGITALDTSSVSLSSGGIPKGSIETLPGKKQAIPWI